MIDDRMALAEMLEKASDGDLLREMIAFMAQQLMDADARERVYCTDSETAQQFRFWIG